uniref:S100/CaBP-9k-type calcium binding subdomain domain-containing protein n=1 Tax=Ficedula albicollis TaxID=59894 RepID=A0A803W4S4_FICAL
MSKLIKAITDMLQNPQGSTRKGRKPEPFSRSEFKKLIQQEFAPVKRPPSSKYRSIRASDPDAEPMTKERAPAKPCVY